MSLNLSGEAHKSGWLHDLRDHWLLVSAGYFGACIAADLDKFVTNKERANAILGTSERSLKHFRAFGSYVPANFINSLGIENPVSQNWPIEWFELIADRFNKLLSGELATDASTSPVLPATRKGQRWDEGPQPRNA